MPAADRNLDTIFRSERPDISAICSMVKTTAQAIEHLHEKKMIHGDLKLLNVVRVKEKLCLIDLDASAVIGEGCYAGAKFR
jgi:tRNA A-37 threonylcarbamoyl transferase component Bud32